jgi:hypothetical protein
MKSLTPVEELFQLLWDTPKDKLTWFAIKNRMLEKEKEVAQQYAEFAIECDRKELAVLEFDGWINL